MSQPTARIYTHRHEGHMRAVLILDGQVDEDVIRIAAGRINTTVSNRKSEPSLDLNLLPTGEIVLLDRQDKHPPSRMLTKAKALATLLGCESKVIAPPR